MALPGGNEWCLEGILLSSHDEATIGGRGVMVLLWRKWYVSAAGDESERRRGSASENGWFCGESPDCLPGSAKTVPTPKDSREGRGWFGAEGGGEEGAGGILKRQKLV